MLSPENRKLPAEDLIECSGVSTCLSVSKWGGDIPARGCLYMTTGAARGRAAVEGDMSASTPGKGERESAMASSLRSGAPVPPGARIQPPPPSQLSSATKNPVLSNSLRLDFPKRCAMNPSLVMCGPNKLGKPATLSLWKNPQLTLMGIRDSEKPIQMKLLVLFSPRFLLLYNFY